MKEGFKKNPFFYAKNHNKSIYVKDFTFTCLYNR